jgi:lipopolysaccharide export system permease protein
VKKLHLLVIKSFIGPLVLTFFFVIFVLLMQFLWKYIDDLIGKGLEWNVISEFLLYTSASLVPLAMPLAVLLASLMTFGNLAENLELLAFKSSGISLIRIMAPVMVISALISVGAFLFANNVMPVTNLKMRSLLYDIQQQRPELTIKPGVFDNTLEGYSIRIGDRDSKTSLLKDILIFDHTQKYGNTRVTVADSGYMKMSADEKHLLLSLYNGYSYFELQKEKKEDRQVKSYPLRRDKFDHQEMIIEMVGFGLNRTDENLFRNSYSMLNLSQLQHFDDSLTEEISEIQDKFHRTIELNLTDRPKSMLIKREYLERDTAENWKEEDRIVEQLHMDSAYGTPQKTGRRKTGSSNNYIWIPHIRN